MHTQPVTAVSQLWGASLPSLSHLLCASDQTHLDFVYNQPQSLPFWQSAQLYKLQAAGDWLQKCLVLPIWVLVCVFWVSMVVCVSGVGVSHVPDCLCSPCWYLFWETLWLFHGLFAKRGNKGGFPESSVARRSLTKFGHNHSSLKVSGLIARLTLATGTLTQPPQISVLANDQFRCSASLNTNKLQASCAVTRYICLYQIREAYSWLICVRWHQSANTADVHGRLHPLVSHLEMGSVIVNWKSIGLFVFDFKV